MLKPREQTPTEKTNRFLLTAHGQKNVPEHGKGPENISGIAWSRHGEVSEFVENREEFWDLLRLLPRRS